MIGCSRTHVRKQTINALYFKFENEFKFNNLGARFRKKTLKLTFLTPRLLMFAAKFPMEFDYKYHLYQNIAHSFYGPVKEYTPPPKIKSFFFH